MTTLSSNRILGVMALECAPGSRIERDALGHADAARLAGLLGRDLGLLVPGVCALDLALSAIHYDPAEVLRPGWPLHDTLDQMRLHAPGRMRDARVIAFGAAADGVLPEMLRADAALHGGQLRVLPFVLAGDADVVAVVARQLEDSLLDLGMFNAETALHAQQAFGAKIEHARYLTVYDLAAMTGLQYRNQGLEHVWHFLEGILLAPDSEAWLDTLPEPMLHYAAREARMAMFTPDAWRARHAPDVPDDDSVKLRRGFDYFQVRQRQVASIVQAHGVLVTFVHCDERSDARTALAQV